MARSRRLWRMRIRTMLIVVGVSALACGVCVLTWRTVWGPWPCWVRAVHSSDDYYKITLNAAMTAVEGKDPDITSEAAIPELIAVLDDPKDFPRIAAMTALGRAGPRAARAVPKLIVLLKDQASIQAHAAYALAEIVTRDSADKDAVIAALLAAANDASPRTPAYALVRVHVIQALCRLVGPDDSRQPDVAKLLTRSLADPDSLVRTTALSGLVAIAPGQPGLAELLKRSLADENGVVRATAGLGLIRIGRGHEAVPVLTVFQVGDLGNPIAQLGLGLMGARTAEATAALHLTARTNTDPWLKKAARDALAH